MITSTCDQCSQPIRDVLYRLNAVAADDPEQLIRRGPDLHYGCIADWVIAAHTRETLARVSVDEETERVVVTLPYQIDPTRVDIRTPAV